MASETNSNMQTATDSGASSKAGWILLGAAAVLAAGSIGYNAYESSRDDPELEIAANGTPSLEALRAAANDAGNDSGLWAQLGAAYSARQEFAQAAAAYQRAIDLDPSQAELWAALGEAKAYAAGGSTLPGDALAAFEQALALDPSNPSARYFMAVKQDLEGDHEGAIASWLALLSDTPPGAPWEASLVQTIQQVGAINDIAVETRIGTVNAGRSSAILASGSGEAVGDGAPQAVRGPTQQQIADVSRLAPGEQDQLIANMVAGLEARLEDEPGNLEGWVMLMRSRMTLGEPDKARDALAKAIAANPEDADELRRQAERLGIR